MKYKPNQSSTQKHDLNAPNRRSLGYWIYIVFFAFFIPLIFITIGITMLLNAIAPKFIVLGFFISPLLALYISRKAHNQMLSLNDEEYEKRFNIPAVAEDHNAELRKNNPYDPASSLYWTIGPGSHRYKNKF